ncbi:ABC transporter permease [Cohnella endophytica]|uniref:ABC transporter permease n=1 Tax=Cohnella endophytica TaxID=2419778 RepID=A0A494Y179_9BACL|nr:ABC-2 family transporter protein [Cohnella endophytica]RKP55113.1 ABC transporter permease [Cohnella endophytica]
MRAYLSVFRLRLSMGLQYRTAALAGIATQFFWGFLILMVFVAFYSQSSIDSPISLPQIADYIWLQQAFLALIVLWFRDNELFQLITGGNIAYELCRPSELYGFWYAKLLAQRLSGALLRCFPILLVAAFLPEPYRLNLPATFEAAILSFVALLFGLLILVSISMLIYISTFVTMSPAGSLLLFAVLGEFLAGMIIPIPLMPSWMRSIVYALPFRFTSDFPFRIYSGHIPVNEALKLLPLQLAWLAALVAVGKYTMSKALRRVVVQGG